MKHTYSNKLMTKSARSIGISHDDPNVTDYDHIRYDACLDIDANMREIRTSIIVSSKSKFSPINPQPPHEDVRR
jgi:AraC family transcriptional regulator